MTAMTLFTPAAGPSTPAARLAEAARRLFDAEIALHAARQTDVDLWISAACDKLHLAIIEHTEAAFASARAGS